MLTSETPSSRTTEPIRHQPCPKCETTLPVYELSPTWCDQCGWNLEPSPVNPYLTLFDKLHLSISQRSSRQLFEQMLKDPPTRRHFSGAKVLAYLLAGCVHGITFVLILAGIWFSTVTLPNLSGLLLGIPCFLLAWVFAPQMPKLTDKPLDREEFPTLYALVDEVGKTLNSPAVDGIIATVYWPI